MFTYIKERLIQFLRDEDGASAVEYAVLLAMIIAVCILMIEVLGGKVANSYDSLNTKFN